MRKNTAMPRAWHRASLYAFLLVISAGRMGYAQSPADSLELYSPFARPSELPRILDTYFSIQGEKESALIKKYQSDLAEAKKTQDRKKTAKLYFQLGDLYVRGENSNAALINYFEALRIAGEDEDTLTKGLLFIRIGRAYALTEILLNTEYTTKGCALLQHVKDPEIQAIVQYARCAIEPDPAKSHAYGSEALRLQREVMKFKPNDTTALENLSKYLNATGRWEEAIAAAEQAGSARLIVYYLNNYGYDNHEKGKYAAALALYTRAVQLCKSERLKGLLLNTYHNLGLLYQQMGEYKNAARYLELQTHVRESIYRENYIRQYAENIVRYETELKELANSQLRSEQERLQQGLRSAWVFETILYLLLVAVVTLLVFGFFGRRELRAANALLTEQKDEIDKRRQDLERAHAKLSESEMQLNAAQQLAQVANWEWDRRGNTLSFSDFFPVLFALSPAELHTNFRAAILSKVHLDDYERVNEVLTGMGLGRQGEYESKYRIVIKGETKWIKALYQVVADERGNVAKVMGTVQDITAQQNEEALKVKFASEQSFTAQLLESQEEERKRIASEIHDGLGQEIVALKSIAEIALTETMPAATAAESLRRIANLVPDLLQSLRRIAYNLRPVHLERTGLSDALIDLFRQAETTSGIAFDTLIDDFEQLLPVKKELHIFRIAQEALSNINKHSKAKRVEIKMHRQEQSIVLQFDDDGVGFNTEEVMKNGGGFGLHNIGNRVELLGGELSVSSTPGTGTTIFIHIPVKENGT